MLPAARRVTDPATFRTVIRNGRRGSSRSLVVHLVHPEDRLDQPSRAGLVVGRSVGNSVVRHRVQRRLRHLLLSRLADLGSGSDVVVRALAPAASMTSSDLGSDLDRALSRAVTRR